MIVSHRHKFVLLMPWKTGSSTINTRLQPLNESSYQQFFYFNPTLNRVVHQHITYAEFAALPESKLGYKVGVFVRNPYDRVYSGFLQVKRDIEGQLAAPFKPEWIRSLVKQQLSYNQTRLFEADYDFDKWVALLQPHEIFDVGRNTNLPIHPASHWTHQNGKRMVDFIGKVENFENDFTEFCKLIDILPPENVNANVTDKVWNGDGSRYTNRMSEPTIAKINELFESDFRLLNYTSS
jgi:hypothetical protein